jgi:hypothetical protein
LFVVLSLFQDAGDESQQFIERVKSGLPVRGDVLDPAFEPPGRNVRLRPELDHEGRLLLP